MPEVKDKTTGQVIAKMPYDTAGKMAAEKMVAENPGYEIKDGAQRSEQMYAGGGQAGFNSIGNPMYKEGGRVNKLGETIKTNRGEGDKYKTYWTKDGPAGGHTVLVEEDLDARDRRAVRAKKSKARKAKAAAEAKAKQKARDDADRKAYEEYKKNKGPNDPPYQP